MESPKSTFSLYYYINKSRKDSKNRCPIYLRITLNGTETSVSIQRKILIEDWSVEGGCPAGKSDEVKEVKNYITILNSKVLAVHKELLLTETTITASTLKAHAFGMNYNKQVGILQLFQERIDKEKELFEQGVKSIGEYCRYKYTAKYLKEFIKVEDVPVARIDRNFIDNFINFLKLRDIDRFRIKRKLAKNTINQSLQKFKAILETAIKCKIISENPFGDISISLDIYGKRVHFTEDELSLIINAPLPKSFHRKERDFFLFCCFTGLSSCDFSELKRVNIERESGQWWLRTYRNKTEVLSNVPLLPQAEAIIRKYNPEFEKMPYDNPLFPVPEYHTRLVHIKEIAKICGISKHVGTHTARHTFATTVTLTNGVSLESVSKMLGHKSLRMTEHYAQIVNSKIANDMELLKGKIANTYQ